MQQTQSLTVTQTLFNNLGRLIDLAGEELSSRMDDVDSESFHKQKQLLALNEQGWHNIKTALREAKPLGESGDVALTIFLSNDDAVHLGWLLELAKDELACRMTSLSHCMPDIAEEIEMLYHAGLSEVKAAINANMRVINTVSADNHSRVKAAEAALTTFSARTGCDDDDAQADLLANLMHFSATGSADFERDLAIARMHIEDEAREQQEVA